MKKRKIFWGIFFIAMAMIVVISKLGILPDVGAFSILATVFLLWMAADGVRHRNFYEMMCAVAFLCIIYDKPLGIEALTPWTVLAAALLLSIGLSLLFGGKGKKKRNIELEWSSDGSREIGSSSEQCSGEQIRCENNFGSAIRYINSDNFCKAYLENNFGSMTIYFDNAIIQGDTAFVKIDNNFGETILYIPKEWKVQNELEHCFGNINEHGKAVGTSNAVLHLKGETNFGSIEIYYV
ncbi:MAG: hypothetical protein K2N44_06435 [Lachnospiraceae bacterium]|nr:hypothetical protein [Lachnospiraceae bacterium]